MSPEYSLQLTVTFGLPRASGDEPIHIVESEANQRSAPRERG